MGGFARFVYIENGRRTTVRRKPGARFRRTVARRVFFSTVAREADGVENPRAVWRAEGEKKLRLSGIILKDLRVARLMDEQELTLGRLFNKDESPSKTRKDLLEEGEIRQLGLHAVGKARELAERISSGEIERLPMITGKRRACEYCPYQGICRIDWQAGDKGRTVPGMSLEQVLQEIRDQR